MLRKTINWFVVYYFILGVTAAGTMWFYGYLLSGVPSDERALAVSLTLHWAMLIEAIFLAGFGLSVLGVYSLLQSRDGEGWIGSMLSVICLTITATAAFAHAAIIGEARNDIVLLGIAPSVFLVAAIVAAVESRYRISQCVEPVAREKQKLTALCTYQRLCLSLFGAPGLWLYFEAVITHTWSPWWTLLLLVAYAGALRVLIPIVVQFLKWPIMTEKQLDI